MGVGALAQPTRGTGTRKKLVRQPSEADVSRRFDEWLPLDMRAAPGIDWESLPARIKFYLWNGVGDSPDASSIALVAALVRRFGSTTMSTLSLTRDVNMLLRRLRRDCGLVSYAQLGESAFWDAVYAIYNRPVAKTGERSFPPGVAAGLKNYHTATDKYLRTYAHEVQEGDGARAWQDAIDALARDDGLQWRDLLLPPMPPRWWERSGIWHRVRVEASEEILAKTEVLVRLHTPLAQLAVMRQRAVKSLYLRYRQELARALRRGPDAFPWHFAHEVALPHFATNAPATVAEIQIEAPRITLDLSIWDRPSWARAHADRLARSTRRHAKAGQGAYGLNKNGHYLEVHNSPTDIFWFGPILANKALGWVHRASVRRPILERFGEPRGFHTTRPGLLDPEKTHADWLRANVQPGELLFDLEALYRGVLYGAALAVAALTSAPRISELLQFSDLRWDRIEAPAEEQSERPTEVLVQMVLTKRHREESERHPKLIGPDLQPLLREIVRLLERHHGGFIPVIQPTKNVKAEHLQPEPYIFQWSASPDGKMGLLDASDAGALLRFLYHGVELRTMRGEPFDVGVHLCRHATASKAAEDGLPSEAWEVLLTHEPGGRSRRTPPGSAATNSATLDYTTAGRRNRALRMLATWGRALSTRVVQPMLRVPDEEHMAQLDTKVRAVLERFGLLAATDLGWCSAGLCVRDSRRHCVGCPFLVEDYRMLGYALRLRRVLLLDIELGEQHGAAGGTRDQRQMLENLDGHIHWMRMQGALAAAGTAALPHILTLPLPTLESEEES